MRAIVFAEPGTFSLEEVPDPVVGPRDVLVRVEAVGLCGTDLHVLDGEFAPTVFPIIPGHETSGVVEAVGDQVDEFAPGDRVSVDPTLTCGHCSLLYRRSRPTCARTGTGPASRGPTAPRPN